jgi:adenine-specific DNA-methyltransferase
MNNKLQKLELTWIGKGEEPKLEPRILIEQSEYSYGDPASENMLIHGDNLLALKALEQEYTGKVKCIYIDPPYNTGSAFEHYDDGVEHSIWLNLMKARLVILWNLLDSKEGSIWISIDDNECHYLKVICDEIFGRQNYISTIAVKMSTASGVKTSHREKTIIKEKEFIVCYAKNSTTVRFNPQYVPKLDWDDEFQYVLNRNNSSNSSEWKVSRLRDELAKLNIPYDQSDAKFKAYVIKNAGAIWRRAFIRNEYKLLSQNNPDQVIYDSKVDNYYYRGRQMYFFKDRFHRCFTENGYEELPSYLLGDFWVDINTGKLFNEGGVDFRNGKKPEFLVARIFELASNPGDLVLDSFLGSGTTAAVAHKMGRRWIGVELGEHAKTHCYPRLKQVVAGTDQGGISKALGWKGGGGFRFYRLAPSLLKQDKYGNWIIEEKYNPDMLAAAMAKQEGFRYQPDEAIYWKQGRSAEKDFIYTTTQFITAEALDKIQEEMKPGETVLICCKAYQKECESMYSNITIKKIPQVLLGRCEYGRDDYSLNIIQMPTDESTSVDSEPELPVDLPSGKENKKNKSSQTSLF